MITKRDHINGGSDGSCGGLGFQVVVQVGVRNIIWPGWVCRVLAAWYCLKKKTTKRNSGAARCHGQDL